ncbi:MAG TPA: TIGR00269 family protein [Thermoplasmata archaeon]|nr:TIGR00269 family protein [Thermoplasmata archaeon]
MRRIVRCSTCSAEAVIDQPYRGAHLCATHFQESVEERVRREMHRQLPRFGHGTVAVALSGGKDSGVALTLAHRYFRRRPTVRVVALSVDEGISGYRSGTLRAARDLTESLGVEHHVVSAREVIGTTIDRTASELPGTIPCSYCGVWRRQLLNRAARDVGADALVLGFNLDDLAQTVLMNLVRGDLDRLVRMAPHRVRQPGLVPRVAPLAQVPEREVYLFARLRKIPFDHGECPHAGRASRNLFREIVWQLEEAQPGTRQALLRTHERLVSRFLADGVGSVAPNRCRACGEPAANELCRACEYLEVARTAPSAPEAS